MALRVSSSAALQKLQAELRRSKYGGALDVAALSTGEPVGYLPLLHFALLGTSQEVAVWVTACGYTLSSASDERFVAAAHRLLREQLGERAADRNRATAPAFFFHGRRLYSAYTPWQATGTS